MVTDTRPKLSKSEAEELLKGYGFNATLNFHPNELVTVTAFAQPGAQSRVQAEVEAQLAEIQRKYKLVERRQ